MNRLPEPDHHRLTPLPSTAAITGNLPRPFAPGQGVLHGLTPLPTQTAIELAFLPSVAQEQALYRRRATAVAVYDNARSTFSVIEEGQIRRLTMHLLAEEHHHPGQNSELRWAHTNSSLKQNLTAHTTHLLGTIHHLAEERELGLFHGRFLRGIGGPLPIGRVVSAIAAELLETPLTPLGVQREDKGRAILSWYLVDDTASPHQPHRIDSERERLVFCRNVIETGFQLGHTFIEQPLDAVVALGQRLGLLSGKSDSRTAYVVAPNSPDNTGEPLALIIRPGSPAGRVPGIAIGWAHHDLTPRPRETRRSS
jgi:hypothetical protein